MAPMMVQKPVQMLVSIPVRVFVWMSAERVAARAKPRGWRDASRAEEGRPGRP